MVVLAVIFLCVKFCGSGDKPDPQEAQQKTQKEVVTEEAIFEYKTAVAALYEEFANDYKTNPEFLKKGFVYPPAADWQKRFNELDNKHSPAFFMAYGYPVMAGDLNILALEYLYNEGRETQTAARLTEKFEQLKYDVINEKKQKRSG